MAPANQPNTCANVIFPVPKTGFGGAWSEKTRLDTFGPLPCKPTRNLPKCYFPAQNRFWGGAGLYSHGKDPLACKPTQHLPKYYFPVPKTGFGGALVCILTEKTNLRHLQTNPEPAQMLFSSAKTSLGGTLKEKTHLSTFRPCPAANQPRTCPNVIFQCRKQGLGTPYSVPSTKRLIWTTFRCLACQNLPKCYFPVPKTGFGAFSRKRLVWTRSALLPASQHLPKCFFATPKTAPSRKRLIWTLSAPWPANQPRTCPNVFFQCRKQVLGVPWSAFSRKD